MPREFTLTEVFKRVSSIHEGQKFEGPTETHFDIEWFIAIGKEDDCLKVSVNCEPIDAEEDAYVDADVEFKLISASGKKCCRIEPFQFVTEDCDGIEILDWERVMKDYVVDDTFIIEVLVKISKTSGIFKKNFQNFGDMKFADVCLVVEGDKFYESKLFLARQSTYFENLLMNPNFVEGQKTEKAAEEGKIPEFVVQDLKSEDFQRFSEDIHGSDVIDDSSVSGILEVARYVDELNSVRRCEDYLINSSQLSFKKKFELVREHNLVRLKNDCLMKIETKEQIIEVIPGDIYEMESSVACALLNKYIALDRK
uniref:BTB domain-containing protein n=1 Tax=Caenorhabditis tropicalis TaxID=1561998 RepID=A0A1I7U5E2_9PELO